MDPTTVGDRLHERYRPGLLVLAEPQRCRRDPDLVRPDESSDPLGNFGKDYFEIWRPFWSLIALQGARGAAFLVGRSANFL